MNPPCETQRPLFENRYVCTARLLRSILWKLTPWWIQAVYVLWIAAGIFCLLFVRTRTDAVPALAVVLLVTAVLGLLMPVLNAASAARGHRRAAGGTATETILRYTDREIVGCEAQHTSRFGYEQIRSVRCVGRMWLLTIGRRQAIIVNRDGFTEGRAEEFPAFIRAKCPGIKGSFNQ